MPWGIAVDGEDAVWVANFGGHRVARLCGTDPNVWLVNNWRTAPLQANPGGHELVVLVGAAAPVPAPRLGGPGRP
ncbi:hypothetical protein [Kitasatospora sp. NPDC001527]|uniref:hypothetical protein n=1 Tax=Kitasatospora sp. NPDC001527 TaxID=3154519 RepID=UPI00332E32F1